MSETQSHRKAKRDAAGRAGQTEVRLPGGKRLDALSKTGVATEIERSGTTTGLRKAAKRLKASRARRKVLGVPDRDIPIARKVMRRLGVRGKVTNLSRGKKKQARKYYRASKRP